jgi:phage tail sheath protein FI
MGEQIFRTPGVMANEIDQTGAKPTTPSGVPAGVIGTSKKGPAFIPITLPNFSTFISTFGDVGADRFGALAMKQWFNNGQHAGTFMRLLGVGDGKRRTTTGNNQGRVTRAGFVVGDQLVEADLGGIPGHNPYAGANGDGHGLPGRAFLLGCFMSESRSTNPQLDSMIFREADILEGTTGNGHENPRTNAAFLTGSKPILRGFLMTPSGVIAALSGTTHANNTPLTSSAARRHTNVVAAGGPGGGGPPGRSGASYTVATFGLVAGLEHDYVCGGGFTGDVDKSANGRDAFVILLNGHNATVEDPAVITCSFDYTSDAHFAKALNTDVADFEKRGHFLYAHWDIDPSFAIVTGSNSTLSGTGGMSFEDVVGAGAAKPEGRDIAFLVTASIAQNSGTSTVSTRTAGLNYVGVPNFDNFEDRYRDAFSPWVTSQKFGGGPLNLFRIYALSDGVGNYAPTDSDLPPERLKISITNIKKSESTKAGQDYGTFDLEVRDIQSTDQNPAPYKTFTELSLNPTSDNYIARQIGDMNLFYDWDRAEGSQKLVMEGSYPATTPWIRVEVSDNVKKGPKGISPTALPAGFRGHWHLVTSGSEIINAVTGTYLDADSTKLGNLVQPPVPFRRNLVKNSDTAQANSRLYWGVQTTVQTDVWESNKGNLYNTSIDSWTKYFPRFHTDYQNPWVGDNWTSSIQGLSGTILNSDVFDNNAFSLENVQVITRSNAIDIPDPLEWAAARYRRDGVLSDLTKSDGVTDEGRFLDFTKDFGVAAGASTYMKFTFFLQGGFNGVNIFDDEKSRFTDLAIRREFDDITGQGGVEGCTISAYRKALDILGERADADIQLLAIPGIRHPAVTNYAIETVENRFDALYLMDIEEKDAQNTYVTGSRQLPDVGETVRTFADRNLDTSFAAAYFPNLRLKDNVLNATIVVPPTVAVLGAFGLNDSLGHPWFAPAGFKRGALKAVDDTNVKLNIKNLDNLYDADINPIRSYAGSAGPIVWGQKTLLVAQSALDRVNVRRLLIDIRRKVRKVANTILFEPNRASTLARFSAAVTPILTNIQQNSGLEKFRVQIDTSTTTQADVENNTIRGKIFLKPTKTAEFIALDFVVTNKINDDAL